MTYPLPLPWGIGCLAMVYCHSDPERSEGEESVQDESVPRTRRTDSFSRPSAEGLLQNDIVKHPLIKVRVASKQTVTIAHIIAS